MQGLGVTSDVVAQRGVVHLAQCAHDAVDHSGREHAVLLEDAARLVQTVGAGYATVGQLSEALEAVGILLVVDIDVNVGALGNIEGILHLEAMAASHAQSRDELVNVGRAVGAAHLHGLLERGVDIDAGLLRIGLVAQVDA